MINKCVSLLSILLFSAAVCSAPLEQTQTIDPTTTNFSTVVSFDQFDDMGGTLVLESVSITMNAMLNGTIQTESLDQSASSIQTNLDAMLSLSGGLGELLSFTIPTVVNMFSASAFDGSVDFGGTSGVSYFNLGGAVSSNETYVDGATLAFFTGTGTEDFTFDALASSFVTGSGNMFSSFNMMAGASIIITYESVNAFVVNAPATFALFGLSMLAFFGFNRIKR